MKYLKYVNRTIIAVKTINQPNLHNIDLFKQLLWDDFFHLSNLFKPALWDIFFQHLWYLAWWFPGARANFNLISIPIGNIFFAGIFFLINPRVFQKIKARRALKINAQERPCILCMIGPRGAAYFLLSSATFLTSFSEQHRRTFNYCIPLSAAHWSSILGNWIFRPRPNWEILNLIPCLHFSAVLSPRNAARAGLDSAAGLLRADAAARVQLWRLWLNLNFSISADAAVCVESHSLFLFACRNMIVYALINPRKKRLHIDILTVCDRCCDFLLLNLSISISCHPSTDHACIYVFLRITRRDDYMCVLHVKILFKIAPKKEKFLQHNKPFLVLLKICGFLTSQNEHLILPVPRGELKCCYVYPAAIRFFAIACYHVRNFMDLQM